MLSLREQRGLTIVELMISLLVSSFIVLAASTHYTITYRATLQAQKTAEMMEQFTHVEQAITSAIRQSGFLYSFNNLILHLSTETAALSSTDLESYAATIFTSSNCVIVKLGTEDAPYAQLGFKLASNTIQTLSGSNLGCESGAWAEITKSSVLSFETLSVQKSGVPRYYDLDNPDAPDLDYDRCFGTPRSNNCAVSELWELTLCALPPNLAGGTCSDATSAYYSSVLIAPRNPVMTGATSN